MIKLTDSTTKFFLVSATSWLLIAVLTNLFGNSAPVLFQFERYFIACALFGLGLGFFKEENKIADRPLRLDGGWAVWLAVASAALLLAACINCPGGWQNAIALALLDESHDIYDFALLKHTVQTDIFTVLYCALLLFASVQIFVAPGRFLKNLIAQDSGKHHLVTFSGAAAVAWLIYAILIQLGVPVYWLLAPGCLGFLYCSQNKKLCATLCLFAAVTSIYIGTASLPVQAAADAAGQGGNQTFWAAGSRIDTRSLTGGGKVLGISLYKDRQLYQVLPRPDLNAGEALSIQKEFDFPQFALDFRLLPFLALPPVKGKNALILGSGLGSEAQTCLSQSVSHIVAVEPDRWLAEASKQQSFSPYGSPQVTLEAADPRGYLRQSKDKFDLILYTVRAAESPPCPLAPLNRNDYLFTAQAFADAYYHLSAGGHLIVACQPANEVVRLRLAATMLAVRNKIDASLTTPFANYLIATKNDDSFAAADNLVGKLREKLGGKIVNHEQWLIAGADGVSILTDDRPFMIGQSPMMVVAETFFMVVSMLAMVLAMRLHTPETMLQNITRQRCRSVMLGAIVMVLFARASMVVALQSGLTLYANYFSLVFGWIVVLAAGLLSYRKSILPVWLLWTAFVFALGADCNFNYDAAALMPAGPMKIIGTMIMPWLTVFFASLVQGRRMAEEEGRQENFGLFISGLALGCLFAMSALFNGIASLDALAASLAGLSGLLAWLPSKQPRGIITPT